MVVSQPRPSIQPPHRILVVDDHPLFRAGLVGLMSHESDLDVCGEAHNAAQALDAIKLLNPDLAIVDIGLPDKNGLELLKDIQALHPGVDVLIISMHAESLYAERVLRAGGRGYIMKNESPGKIMQAIRRVLEGKVYVSEATSAAIMDGISAGRAKEAGAQIAKLTNREFEILNFVSQGLNAPEIARHLGVSLKTVDTHRMHIRDKLGLKNNTELIHYAARWTGA